MLDDWPLLPIVVSSDGYKNWGKGNIIGALKHNDRICEVDVCDIPKSILEDVLVVMLRPFPELTRLRLRRIDRIAPAIPATILGGSAPRLQSLLLDNIPFPGLPELLLSTTHLVSLRYWNVAASSSGLAGYSFGYIATEEMVTCLSMLTRLERLEIGFSFYASDQRPSPQPRTALPVLTELRFHGLVSYLEDFVAQIDAPLLKKLTTTFIIKRPASIAALQLGELAHFISRTPQFRTHNEARVAFSGDGVSVTLPQMFHGTLHTGLSCFFDLLLSLGELCKSLLLQALIPMVEHLYICDDGSWYGQAADEKSQWLELLHQFTAMKDLYISNELLPRIAPALQELVREGVTEVLPALQTLFLEETVSSSLVQETIWQFVAARQLAGFPVTISGWERKY